MTGIQKPQTSHRVAATVIAAACLLNFYTVSAADGPEGDVSRGAVAWAQQCQRCHNMRDPMEFRDDRSGLQSAHGVFVLLRRVHTRSAPSYMTGAAIRRGHNARASIDGTAPRACASNAKTSGREERALQEGVHRFIVLVRARPRVIPHEPDVVCLRLVIGYFEQATSNTFR